MHDKVSRAEDQKVKSLANGSGSEQHGRRGEKMERWWCLGPMRKAPPQDRNRGESVGGRDADCASATLHVRASGVSASETGENCQQQTAVGLSVNQTKAGGLGLG